MAPTAAAPLSLPSRGRTRGPLPAAERVAGAEPVPRRQGGAVTNPSGDWRALDDAALLRRDEKVLSRAASGGSWAAGRRGWCQFHRSGGSRRPGSLWGSAVARGCWPGTRMSWSGRRLCTLPALDGRSVRSADLLSPVEVPHACSSCRCRRAARRRVGGRGCRSDHDPGVGPRQVRGNLTRRVRLLSPRLSARFWTRAGGTG
jgi:hypothetical protein